MGNATSAHCIQKKKIKESTSFSQKRLPEKGTIENQLRKLNKCLRNSEFDTEQSS